MKHLAIVVMLVVAGLAGCLPYILGHLPKASASRQPEYNLWYNDCFANGIHYTNFSYKTEQEATNSNCTWEEVEINRITK